MLRRKLLYNGHMTLLLVRLFGAFQVSLNGQAVTQFPTDKIRALLVYLLRHPDQPLRRDTLMGLLWADLPQQAAQHNLRQSLYLLRRTFDVLQPQFSSDLLTITRQSVTLHGAFVESDLGQMAQLLARGEGGDAPIDSYSEAVALYRGEFLAGFSLADAFEFDEWLLLEREMWSQQTLQILHMLTQFYQQQGDMAQVLVYAARQLEMEPLRESACRSLMAASAAQGQRSKALAYYEACRHLLLRELGVAPAAETVALYEQIKAEASAPQGPDLPPAQLPPPAMPLVGREEELAQVRARLQDPACRLLTLLGAGGIGKTSLALAAARQPELAQLFPNGRFFIQLAGLTSAEFLLTAIGRGMGLSFSGRGPEKAQLWDYCRAKKCLLILDNFEHLAAGAPLLAELAAVAPGVRLLVTSRVSLNLQMEERLPLAGLRYPAGADEEGDYSAVALFVQAGQRVLPDFRITASNVADVHQICRLVQGSPLALEFAAAWLRLMDCGQIAAEIRRNLNFLTSSRRDTPERHQSMLAVFEQSWQLLTPSEQSALVQLAYFRGGFTLDAVFTITGATMTDLAGLLDKSLLGREENGRYSLHELLRQFGLQKAEAEHISLTALGEQHSRAYLTFVQKREMLLYGIDSQRVLLEIQQDLNNIQQAWQTAVHNHAWDDLLAGIEGVSTYYLLAGALPEAKAVYLETLQYMEMAAAAPVLYGYLLEKLGVVYARQSQYQDATDVAQQLLALGKALPDPDLAMRARMILGRVQQYQGGYEQALADYETAVVFYAATGDSARLARLSKLIGIIYQLQGSYDEALNQQQQALRLSREQGNRIYEATVLSEMGVVHTERSEANLALACFQQALEIDRESGHQEGVARNLHNMGRIYWRQGSYAEALSCFRQALAIAEQLGIRRGVSLCLGNIGIVHKHLKQYEQALDHYQRALAINQELGIKEEIANNLGNMGNLYVLQGNYAEGEPCHEAALQLAEEIGHAEGIARHLGNLATLYKEQGLTEKALAFFDRALAMLRQMDGKYALSSLLIFKAELLLSLDERVEARRLVVEGLQLAREIDRPDMVFPGNLLLVKLMLADGEAEEAAGQARRLLAGGLDEEETAVLQALFSHSLLLA